MSYAMPGAMCLRCGYFVDRATNVTDENKPNEGDFTVCLNCGALNRFDKNMRLVPCSEHDPELYELRPDRLNALRLTQDFIRQRGPIHGTKNVPS